MPPLYVSIALSSYLAVAPELPFLSKTSGYDILRLFFTQKSDKIKINFTVSFCLLNVAVRTPLLAHDIINLQ